MKLEDINKNPFKVPDGYFDNLSDRIMNNIYEEEKKSKKTIKMNLSFVRKAISIAAILILGLIISKPFDNSNVNKNQVITTDSTLTEEEMNYLLLSSSEYEYYLENELYSALNK